MTEISNSHKTELPDNTKVSNDDMLISFVAYISTFFLGILVPIFIYFSYKKKSKFVAFHSLQIIYFSIAYGLLIYFPVSGILKTLGIELISLFPDEPLLNFISSLFIFKILFVGEYIPFIIFGCRSYKGLLSKLPVVGNMAYSKIYDDPHKKSFNLTRKKKTHNTYHDSPPPGTGQGKGLI